MTTKIIIIFLFSYTKLQYYYKINLKNRKLSHKHPTIQTRRPAFPRQQQPCLNSLSQTNIHKKSRYENIS